MRLKLVLLVSLVAATAAFGGWIAIALVAFGSARALGRHDWLLIGSLIIPLAAMILAGVFVYRHTARRRKLQAVITTALVAILTIVSYLIASAMLPARIHIPRTSELRHGL